MTGETVDEVRAGFVAPDPAARPMMRWWWFGPDVEAAEIDRELCAMADAGLGGAEVSVVYPLREGSDTYLSEAALSHLRHAAETARDLGLRLDVTLGSGWSYGGPHIGPEHASRSLRWERRDISPAPFDVPLVTPWPGDELVAAFLGDGVPPESWEPLPLADGVLRVPAGRGPRTVLLAWSQVTGQQVKRSAAGAEGPVLDHLSADATRHHLAVVGEALLAAVPAELLGSVFCDSLEVYQAGWTPRLPEEFTRRRGYDPLPLLHRLQIDEPGSAEFRIDMGLTLTELVEENFLAVCLDWARGHGLPLRIQAYGEPPVTLSSYRYVDLPEGEGWGWTGLPQSRWASSAAHLHGHGVVSSEIWTWVHSPSFRATPLDLKGEAHEHLLLGINQFVGHGWPYSPPEAPGMGWMFYAAGALDDRNPWWPAMPELTRYLTRLSWLLRQGEPVADVKVYLPASELYAAHGEGFDLWRACRDHIGPEIPAAIRRAGYDLDLVDDQALDVLEARSAPVVVLPRVTRLPQPARAWLDAVRESGGTVIAVDSPAYPEGIAADAASLPEVLARSLAPDVALEGDGGEIGVVHRRLADGDVYFVANTGPKVRTVGLTPRTRRASCEQWDPRDPGAGPTTHQGDVATVTLHPYEATVLVASGGVVSAAVASEMVVPDPEHESARPDALRLDGPWRFTPGLGRGAGLGEGSREGTVEVRLPHHWGTEQPVVSGTYETTVSVDPDWCGDGSRLVLDLGPSRIQENSTRQAASYRVLLAPPVREIAVISVGGKEVGVIWDAPHRLDLTGALRAGENTLRLEVHGTAAPCVAADPQAAGIVAESRREYGRRFDQQDLDLALDQVDPGLHAVPVLHRLPAGFASAD
ncbi:glycosyl hydrolase [Brachybacterium tyrofermentans]|uniref:glycosyl hydrolase n=1 Tax=Brachybacterium tyrofermentans TaxID=47848 RepID=UPI0018665263|nr:glycosyl hydrolase [Brachybacterium tyrofermentans]